MIGFISYSGVSSKLYALSSEFLNDEDYKNLMAQSSVQDVVRYLQATRMYSDTIANMTLDEIHRRDLEIMLQMDLIKDLKKIFTFFVTFDKDFSRLMFQRYEIENLKLALRIVLIEMGSKDNVENLKKQFFDLGGKASIDPIKVATSKNQDEILDNLAGSPYQEIVRNAFSSYKNSSSSTLIGVLENAIDSWIFARIISASQKLGTKDQMVVKTLIGERADLTDVEWVVRAKAFYEIKPEELYNSLLPYHFRLGPSDLHAMCDAKGIKELLDFLKECPYKEIYKDMNEETIIDTITIQERRFLREKSLEAITKFGTFSIASFFRYFFLKEYEIMDIISIVEGVRYGLKPEEIKGLVIRKF
jgi:V/A-type H+-transporting ATPase subunit C